MPIEITFTWKGKTYEAVASREWENGVPFWKVVFPSGRYYEFMWKDRMWVHLEYKAPQMPAELKNTICWAFERHPKYREELARTAR